LGICTLLGLSRASTPNNGGFLKILISLGLLLLTIVQILEPMRKAQVHFAFWTFKIFGISQLGFAAFSLTHFSPSSLGRRRCF